MKLPTIFKIPSYNDERGSMSFIERDNSIIDFDIKRIYYLYNIPKGRTRGDHAHKKLQQLMIAISGSIEIILDDGKKKESFLLSSPDEALYVPSGYYRHLKFTKDAICLVIASEKYDESDYIRNYDDFIKWKSLQN